MRNQVIKNPLLLYLLQNPKGYRLLSSASRGSGFEGPSSTWQSLRLLRDGNLERFCGEAFDISVPAILPKGHFRDFPAIRQWFVFPEIGHDVASFNYSYLRQFEHMMISQEYTSIPPSPNTSTEKFSSTEAPFSFFLDWSEKATSSTKERLYIAQASISALPSTLRDDLPTPDLVAKTGRGDIYGANIWMGIPPTYTPLHRDPNPNLLVQLAGHKIVRLLPPNIGHEVFAQVQASIGKAASANIRGGEMMIGEEKSLLEDLIWNNKHQINGPPSSAFEARLGCGDAVFIPKGWWHSVKGVGNGITASVCRHCHSTIAKLKLIDQLVVPVNPLPKQVSCLKPYCTKEPDPRR